MKTKSLILFLQFLSVSVFAQGTVTFCNDNLRLYQFSDAVFPADAAYANQPIPQSPLPSGKTLQAVLYAGASIGNMTLQTSVLLTGGNWLAPGRMADKPLTLIGIPANTTGIFRVFWMDTDTTLPASIDGNLPAGNPFINKSIYFAASELFVADAGNPFVFPRLTSATTSTWQAGPIVNSVPEPSSMTLAGIAGACLLLFRRRK
jgi:hypothetical protein